MYTTAASAACFRALVYFWFTHNNMNKRVSCACPPMLILNTGRLTVQAQTMVHTPKIMRVSSNNLPGHGAIAMSTVTKPNKLNFKEIN